MTADYWKSFWLAHAKDSKYTEPQVQVLRTLHKEPIPPDVFAGIVDSIVTMLRPEPTGKLLDLCCGNGVITEQLLARFQEVVAVDLSEDFISRLRNAQVGNLTAFSADARTVRFPENSFDRILLYAGIQYFSDSETVDLFGNLRRWIRDGGVVVLGDIPDATRKWNFFNTPERKRDYFEALKQDRPLVGNWFDPRWMENLAHYARFSSAEILLQPPNFPYNHYRFDLVLSAPKAG